MKFRIGMVVGAVAVGLALVNPTTGSAAPTVGTAAAADPYPRTVKTVCDARRLKPVYRAGKKERFRVVIIENSTDMPRVRLSFVKQRALPGGGYRPVRKFRPKRYYHGKPVNLPFQTSRAGRFRITVRTSFGPKSQFRNCQDSFTFRVASANSPRPGAAAGTGNGNGQLPSTGAKQED
jgi:hypothetical protein